MKDSRELIIEAIDNNMQDLAEEVCSNYCKYADEYEKDSEKTYKEHCVDCPLAIWFTH